MNASPANRGTGKLQPRLQPVSRISFQLGLLLAGAALGGCLPYYEQPQSATVDSGDLPDSGLIPYQLLSTTDFRARGPATVFSREADFNAYSCLQLRPLPDVAVEAVAVNGGGRTAYVAAPRHLQYAAYFDPACSWWNAGLGAAAGAYVLQHEQVHFAIMEAAALRLNRSAAGITARATVSAGTAEAAIARSQERLRQTMEAEMRRVQREHLRFDEAASHGFHPEAQQAWLQQINTELHTLEDDGTVAQTPAPPITGWGRFSLSLSPDRYERATIDQPSEQAWWNRMTPALPVD